MILSDSFAEFRETSGLNGPDVRERLRMKKTRSYSMILNEGERSPGANMGFQERISHIKINNDNLAL